MLLKNHAPALRASLGPLALALTPAAFGQAVSRSAPIPAPLKNAGTYHVATGTWLRAQTTYGLTNQDTLYRNDLGGAYFALQDEGDVQYDEGRLPGNTRPLLAGGPETGTSNNYLISGFSFGYCAMGSSPATYSVGVLPSYQPCTDPTGVPVVASFDFDNLPVNGCWTVALDLTGSTMEFELGAEGGDGFWDNDASLDSFGLSLSIDQGQGTGGFTTGLVLAGDLTQPATEGDGTVFKNPGSSGTGLGTQDSFWLTSGTIADGCYFFGGCLPCASFDTALFGSPADPTAFCDPVGGNSVSASGAQLTSMGDYAGASASVRVTDVPDTTGILFSGPEEVSMPFGCGTRCIGRGPVLRFGPYVPSGNMLDVTIDMSTSTNNMLQYWYEDPANAMACGASFNLSNALR